MQADHKMMMTVLIHLAEVGSAKSGEIAERLGLDRRYISVVLSRCRDRGLVFGKPYRRGRERGYVYGLSEKGSQWILRKSSRKTVPAVEQPKPEKELVKVLAPVFIERPKSQFDEALGSFKDLYIMRTTQEAHDTVPAMSPLEMSLLRRMEEGEAGFHILMGELKGGMRYDELLEVLKGNQELTRGLLRFIASTKARSRSAGAAVSQSSSLLGARFKADMTGPEPGIREISSGQMSSKTEVAKEELAPDVSSDDIALNRWWNSLPTFTFKPPKSLFPGNSANVLQAALDAGLPQSPPEPSRPKPAETDHWPLNTSGFSWKRLGSCVDLI